MRKNTLYLILSLMLFATAFGIGVFFLFLSNTSPEVTQQIPLVPFQGVKAGVVGQATEPPTLTLIAVGDIMLSRDVERAIKRHGVDYPFTKIQGILKEGDIVFGNLETSVTPGREILVNEMRFRSQPAALQGLVNANVSIVSLANNHVPDFGTKGVLDTVRYLDDAGIRHVGAGKDIEDALAPAFINVKGTTLAFLAFNDHDVVPDSYGASVMRPGTSLMDIDRMKNAVKKAKEHADIVVVSMHSGIEYTAKPNTSQQNFAHAAIDAGAELVLGHHPHVVQTAEKYHGKFIFYSLGNFIFDQIWSEETKRGLGLKITMTSEGVQSVDFFPVYMRQLGQPEPADTTRAKEILARLGLATSAFTPL